MQSCTLLSLTKESPKGTLLIGGERGMRGTISIFTPACGGVNDWYANHSRGFETAHFLIESKSPGNETWAFSSWRRERDVRLPHQKALLFVHELGAPFRTQGETRLAPVRIPKRQAVVSFLSPKNKPHSIEWGLFYWRRERDSNPRWRLLPTNDLANRPLQPLGYLSV